MSNYKINDSCRTSDLTDDIAWLKIRKFDGNFDTMSNVSHDTFETYVDTNDFTNINLDYDYKVKSNYEVAYTDDIHVIMRLQDDINKRESIISLKIGEILIKMMDNISIFPYGIIQSAGVWYWIKLIRGAVFVAVNNYKHDENLNYNVNQIKSKKQSVVRSFDKLITLFLYEFYKIQCYEYDRVSAYTKDILDNFYQVKSRKGNIIYKDVIDNIVKHMKNVGSDTNQVNQDLEKIEILLKSRKNGVYYFNIKAYDNIDDMFDIDENDKYINRYFQSNDSKGDGNDENLINDNDSTSISTSVEIETEDYHKTAAEILRIPVINLNNKMKRRKRKTNKCNSSKGKFQVKKNRVELNQVESSKIKQMDDHDHDDLDIVVNYNDNISNESEEYHKLKSKSAVEILTVTNLNNMDDETNSNVNDNDLANDINEEFEQWKSSEMGHNNISKEIIPMSITHTSTSLDTQGFNKNITYTNRKDNSGNKGIIDLQYISPNNSSPTIASSSYTSIESSITSNINNDSSSNYSLNINAISILQESTKSTSKLELIRSYLSDIKNRMQLLNKISILSVIDNINEQLNSLESLLIFNGMDLSQE